MAGILYIVGTPIGNLEDFSFRADKVLREVDLILCEDTRVTKKLLEHYRVKTPVLSYHQHSKLEKVDNILEFLKNGKNLALVSDSGTPTISDPGAKLISKVYGLGFRVVPIPGPAALIAAASVSGQAMDRFLFLGFPPAKKKRKKFFGEVVSSKCPVIFYESPHRIIKTLNELKDMFHVSRFKFHVVVCRELTKKFETVYRGTIEEVLNQLAKGEIKGEFVIIADKRK